MPQVIFFLIAKSSVSGLSKGGGADLSGLITKKTTFFMCVFPKGSRKKREF